MLGLCTFAIIVILLFMLFLHLGTALGAPLGNYSYNGQGGRKVKTPLRIVSLGYVVLSILFILVYGHNGKLFNLRFNESFVYVLMIIMAVFSILDFFWVFASKSKKEKILKTPLLAILIICSIILLCI